MVRAGRQSDTSLRPRQQTSKGHPRSVAFYLSTATVGIENSRTFVRDGQGFDTKLPGAISNIRTSRMCEWPNGSRPRMAAVQTVQISFRTRAAHLMWLPSGRLLSLVMQVRHGRSKLRPSCSRKADRHNVKGEPESAVHPGSPARHSRSSERSPGSRRETFSLDLSVLGAL